MTQNLHKLIVLFANGSRADIICNKEVGDMAIKEWSSYVMTPDTGDKSHQMQTINGFYDGADRSECVMVNDLEAVMSMTLIEL